MPTVLTHPAVPLAIGLGLGERVVSRRLLLAGVVASVLPDLDTVGMRLGVPYGSPWGHRGFTHSLVMALVLAVVAMGCARWLLSPRWTAFWFVLVSAASHGLLDTLTTGGRGVALLWPFTKERFFAPEFMRAVRVSPIGLQRFAQHGPWMVLRSELVWVWLPMAAIFAALWWPRQAKRNVRGD